MSPGGYFFFQNVFVEFLSYYISCDLCHTWYKKQTSALVWRKKRGKNRNFRNHNERNNERVENYLENYTHMQLDEKRKDPNPKLKNFGFWVLEFLTNLQKNFQNPTQNPKPKTQVFESDRTIWCWIAFGVNYINVPKPQLKMINK